MRTRERHRFRQSSKEHLCWFKVAELWAMPPDNRTGEDDASGATRVRVRAAAQVSQGGFGGCHWRQLKLEWPHAPMQQLHDELGATDAEQSAANDCHVLH